MSTERGVRIRLGDVGAPGLDRPGDGQASEPTKGRGAGRTEAPTVRDEAPAPGDGRVGDDRVTDGRAWTEFSGQADPSPTPAIEPPAAAPLGDGFAWLTALASDLHVSAAAGDLPERVVRPSEWARLMPLLAAGKNPVLVGPPGVGKTALVDSLALGIARGRTAAGDPPVRLLRLDEDEFHREAETHGADAVADWLAEEAAEAAAAGHRVVLVLDPLAPWLSRYEGAFRPHLASGALQLLGVATAEEVGPIFGEVPESDGLRARFAEVSLTEPSEAVVEDMLLQELPALRERYGVDIDGTAVAMAVKLSERHPSGAARPRAAQDLLKVAAATARWTAAGGPPDARILELLLTRRDEGLAALDPDDPSRPALQKARDDLASDFEALREDLAHAHALREEKERLTTRRDELATGRQTKKKKAERAEVEARLETVEAELQAVAPSGPPRVDGEAVLEGLARRLSVSVESLRPPEDRPMLAPDELQAALSARIAGQPHIIEQVVDQIALYQAGLRRRQGVMGSMLLLGPSGTGKTELSKALADIIAGGPPGHPSRQRDAAGARGLRAHGRCASGVCGPRQSPVAAAPGGALRRAWAGGGADRRSDQGPSVALDLYDAVSGRGLRHLRGRHPRFI